MTFLFLSRPARAIGVPAAKGTQHQARKTAMQTPARSIAGQLHGMRRTDAMHQHPQNPRQRPLQRRQATRVAQTTLAGQARWGVTRKIGRRLGLQANR